MPEPRETHTAIDARRNAQSWGGVEPRPAHIALRTAVDQLMADDMDLARAIKDVCWKATTYGHTEDGDIYAYLIPKGAMHRLIAAALSAGIPAAFRALSAPPSDPATDTGGEGRGDG